MDAERADVEQAIAKLRAAVNHLNREAHKRLQAAFEQVDGHFRKLFTTLFGGGEARLEMIEGEDPLEGGLEIIAKPPGKKPATLSLLSGGEQSLTALSLIFAVFLTNPSPICVLDEVDAPLDDANVDRFCRLLEAMVEETATRFLVITHHPMTMARVNRLFGVTMAEKGISQLVSVDLETAQQFREAGFLTPQGAVTMVRAVEKPAVWQPRIAIEPVQLCQPQGRAPARDMARSAPNSARPFKNAPMISASGSTR
jgi:chromosome segregation protein